MWLENSVRRRKYLPVLFFIGGFLFDAVMIERIDAWHVILQQILYLIIVASIIVVEISELLGLVQISFTAQKLWKYHDHIAQFFLGTLLNFYTLFYFKSASLSSAYFFLAILVGLLILNEMLHSFHLKVALRVALFSLSLISFFVALVPILLGFGGLFAFALALIASGAVGFFIFKILENKTGAGHPFLRKNLKLPYLAVQCLFALAYFLQILPPLPLSIRHMGIYRDIQKSGDEFVLTSYRPWWRFWESGDQTFYARAGDKIYCFVSVFSPTRYQEQLQVRWSFKSARGWLPADAIPFEIHGGREEGFRGYTVKANYEPGDWRVQIETSDKREVGRIYLTIVPDASAETRIPRVEKF